MQLRQNADIKDGLLAASDDDDDSSKDSASESSSFSAMSSDDEDFKLKPKKKIETEEKSNADEKVDSKEPEVNGEVDETSIPPSVSPPQPIESPQTTAQQSPDHSIVENNEANPVTSEVNAVTTAPDKDEVNERSKPSYKKSNRDSVDREIFSKGFLEMNGTSKKDKAAQNTSPTKNISRPIKIETNGVKSTDGEKTTDGAIDVSMYDCRPSAKNVDLQKYIERRAHVDVPGTSSSSSVQHNAVKPAPIINEDEWISLSSGSDSEISAAAPTGSAARIPKRKKMLTEEELQEETKKANKEETKRIDRLKKKNETLTQVLSQRDNVNDPLSQANELDELILDYDPKTEATISVHPMLVKKLKEHQKEGVKFMYDNCYGSIADEVKTKSGCVLAHCMGLGKTLQLITLLHTLFSYPDKLQTRKVIVICPKSTIMNWFEEFKKWLMNIDAKGLKVWYLEENLKFPDRIAVRINHFFKVSFE